MGTAHNVRVCSAFQYRPAAPRLSALPPNLPAAADRFPCHHCRSINFSGARLWFPGRCPPPVPHASSGAGHPETTEQRQNYNRTATGEMRICHLLMLTPRWLRKPLMTYTRKDAQLASLPLEHTFPKGKRTVSHAEQPHPGSPGEGAPGEGRGGSSPQPARLSHPTSGRVRSPTGTRWQRCDKRLTALRQSGAALRGAGRHRAILLTGSAFQRSPKHAGALGNANKGRPGGMRESRNPPTAPPETPARLRPSHKGGHGGRQPLTDSPAALARPAVPPPQTPPPSLRLTGRGATCRLPERCNAARAHAPAHSSGQPGRGARAAVKARRQRRYLPGPARPALPGAAAGGAPPGCTAPPSPGSRPRAVRPRVGKTGCSAPWVLLLLALQASQ